MSRKVSTSFPFLVVEKINLADQQLSGNVHQFLVAIESSVFARRRLLAVMGFSRYFLPVVSDQSHKL